MTSAPPSYQVPILTLSWAAFKPSRSSWDFVILSHPQFLFARLPPRALGPFSPPYFYFRLFTHLYSFLLLIFSPQLCICQTSHCWNYPELRSLEIVQWGWKLHEHGPAKHLSLAPSRWPCRRGAVTWWLCIRPAQWLGALQLGDSAIVSCPWRGSSESFGPTVAPWPHALPLSEIQAVRRRFCCSPGRLEVASCNETQSLFWSQVCECSCWLNKDYKWA